MSTYTTETYSTVGPTLDDVLRVLRDQAERARDNSGYGLPLKPVLTPKEWRAYRQAYAIDAMHRDKGLSWVAGARPLVPALALLGAP